MDTNEHEVANHEVMTGIRFWQETALGKALAARLPKEVTRVIIDIPAEDLVKIYYASVNSGPLLDLKWDDVIEYFGLCTPSGMNECQTKPETVAESG